MKKRKKNLKGMTLIEMIISIFVLGLLTMILVMVGEHIDAQSRATNNLKDKIVKEAPYAANKVTKYTNKDGDSVDLKSEDITIDIIYDKDKPKIELTAKKYETVDVVLDGRSAKSQENIKNGFNSGLNLDFIDDIMNEKDRKKAEEAEKAKEEAEAEAPPAESGD